MSVQPTLTQRCLWFVNALFHQTLAVVVVYILWIMFQNYDSNSGFTWHVVLSSLGFLFFMLEAVALFVGENIYAIGLDRKTKVTIHAVLMGLGVLFSSIGIILMIDRKGSHHFNTTHGKIGLSAWIFSIITLLTGIMANYSKELKAYIRPIWVKLVHILLGILAIILGIVTLGYGLDKEAFKLLSTADTVTAATVVIGLLTVWSFFDAFKSIFNYIVTLKDS